MSQKTYEEGSQLLICSIKVIANNLTFVRVEGVIRVRTALRRWVAYLHWKIGYPIKLTITFNY